MDEFGLTDLDYVTIQLSGGLAADDIALPDEEDDSETLNWWASEGFAHCAGIPAA